MSVQEVTQVFVQPDGSVVPATTANPVPVRLGDSPSIDAFNRVRISDPLTLFDSQSQYRDETLLFETVLTGSGTATHDPNGSSVDLAVTTASGDEVLRQSREYIRYQPGKSQLILMTFTPAATDANREQEIGYGDANNGVFIYEAAGTVSVRLRSSTSGSAVDTDVAQASWNIDPMDGTGPSGITLDFTKAQIFIADVEWLGVGRVRTGFVIDGIIYYVHEFNHANNATGVYATTMNLPVRWRIKNTGTASAGGTLEAICCSVISEGGFERDRGLPFAATTPDVGIGSVSTTEVPVLAIRPALTFNSIENRMTVRLRKLAFFSLSAPVMFRVYYNATITGGTWTAANANSGVEYNNSIANATGGNLIDAIPVASGTAGNAAGGGDTTYANDLPLTINITGDTPDNILVTAVRVGGSGTATVGASAFWLEFR